MKTQPNQKCSNCSTKPSSIICNQNLLCYKCSQNCSHHSTHQYIPYHQIISNTQSSQFQHQTKQQKSTSLTIQNIPKTERIDINYSRYSRQRDTSFKILTQNTQRPQHSQTKDERSQKKIKTISNLINKARTKTRSTQTVQIEKELEEIGIQTQGNGREGQRMIQNLKKRLRQQKQRCLRLNQSYRQKLEIFRSLITKSEQNKELQRLRIQNKELRLCLQNKQNKQRILKISDI